MCGTLYEYIPSYLDESPGFRTSEKTKHLSSCWKTSLNSFHCSKIAIPNGSNRAHVDLWTFTNNSGKWNYNADGFATICWWAMWGGKNRHCRICGEPGVASCLRRSSNSLGNKINEGKLGAFKEKQARYFASCFSWRLYLSLQWPLVSLCSSGNWCTLKNGVSNERETEMMSVRWKIFRFDAQIEQSEQRDIPGCARCFFQIILDGPES